jgi:hypothetical protein
MLRDAETFYAFIESLKLYTHIHSMSQGRTEWIFHFFFFFFLAFSLRFPSLSFCLYTLSFFYYFMFPSSCSGYLFFKIFLPSSNSGTKSVKVVTYTVPKTEIKPPYYILWNSDQYILDVKVLIETLLDMWTFI